MPAYPQAAVPEDATYPYLTYPLAVGDWDAGEVNIPVTMWFRTGSEAVPNAAVRAVLDAVPRGGVTIPCDGGMLWVKRGSPLAQAVLTDEGDELVKQRYVNLDFEFLIT